MKWKHLIPFTEGGFTEIIRSEGCHLFDADGNSYLDLESGVWCVNLGHGHKRINRVICKQLDQAVHLGYQVNHQLPEKLSTTLLQKLRFYDGKSVFLSSGSEAVELAIILARRITGRKRILKLEDSYLSAFGAGSEISGLQDQEIIANNAYDKLARGNFSDIAAFVFEPGTSRGMIRFPSAEFVTAIVKKARTAGSLIIVDEVTTGMGRTGKWFGFDHYQISPDMVVCGKGLGNGYPVSSVTINQKMSDEFDRVRFRYAQSHQNDPLGCAIAIEVINEIERKGLVPLSEEKGILFKELLKKATYNHKEIKDIRGRGLMMGIEFQNAECASTIHQKLLEKRMITGLKENVIRIMPPLTIALKDIQQFVDQFHSILNLGIIATS